MDSQSSDQSRYYAQWVVRRIGRALALATFGPLLLAIGLIFVSPNDAQAFDAMFFLGTVALVAVAVLALALARAPR